VGMWLLPVTASLLLIATGCDTSERVSRLEKQNKELQEEVRRETATADYDLQAKCSKDAKAFFREGWGSGGKDVLLLDYRNHYDKKLNKCFILVEYHYKFGEGLSWMNDMSLWDVYENSKYGDFSENHTIVAKPDFRSGDEVITCEVTGTQCKTVQEFNNLISPYLNN